MAAAFAVSCTAYALPLQELSDRQRHFACKLGHKLLGTRVYHGLFTVMMPTVCPWTLPARTWVAGEAGWNAARLSRQNVERGILYQIMIGASAGIYCAREERGCLCRVSGFLRPR